MGASTTKAPKLPEATPRREVCPAGQGHDNSARHACFISYNQASEMKLASLLGSHIDGALSVAERPDCKCFVNTTCIPKLAKWKQEIARALHEASVVVLLVSPELVDRLEAADACASYTLREVHWALVDRGIHILPVAIAPGSTRDVVLQRVAAISAVDKRLGRRVCDVLKPLSDIQWVVLDPTSPYDKMMADVAELARLFAKKACEEELARGTAVDRSMAAGAGLEKLKAVRAIVAKQIKVGEGSSSVVYAGIFYGVHVAVKAIKPESAASRVGAFENEAQLLRGLCHQNVLRCLFYLKEPAGAPPERYLVLPLADQGSLERPGHKAGELLAQGRVLVSVLQAAAGGVAYLHSKWIIHRDLKPANILLATSAGGASSPLSAVVADLGIAKGGGGPGTQDTMAAGTPGYVAPECVFEGRASSRSDVYSFGVVLLSVATGRPALIYSEKADRRTMLADDLRGREATPGGMWKPEDAEMMTGLIRIGRRCTLLERRERPTMAEVVAAVGELLLPDGGPSSYFSYPDLVASEDGLRCTDCEFRERDTVNLPCRHAVHCQTCAERLAAERPGGACLVCRTPVQSLERAAEKVRCAWQGKGRPPRIPEAHAADPDAAEALRLAAEAQVKAEVAAVAARVQTAADVAAWRAYVDASCEDRVLFLSSFSDWLRALPPADHEHCEEPEHFDAVVAPDDQPGSLQGAVDAAVAAAADSATCVQLLLTPGVHRGPLRLPAARSVRLFGRGLAVVEVAGAVAGENAVESTTDSAGHVLDRLGLRRGGAESGVAVLASGGSRLRLQCCIVTNMYGAGAGVRDAGTSPVFSRCLFFGGQSHGVMVFNNATPRLLDCVLRGNTRDGCCVYRGGDPVLERCVIEDNKGRGLWIEADSWGLGRADEWTITHTRNNGGGDVVRQPK